MKERLLISFIFISLLHLAPVYGQNVIRTTYKTIDTFYVNWSLDTRYNSEDLLIESHYREWDKEVEPDLISYRHSKIKYDEEYHEIEKVTELWEKETDQKDILVCSRKYDEEGREIKYLLRQWDEETNAFVGLEKTEHAYEMNRLVWRQETKYNKEEAVWENRDNRRLEYDADACLIKAEIEHNYIGLWISNTILTIENQYDCKNPWRGLLSHRYSDGAFILKRKRIGNKESETLIKEKDLGSSFYREKRYNEEGLETYSYTRWLYDHGDGYLCETEYDIDNKVIETRNYIERDFGNFELSDKVQYEYRYENDLLVEKIMNTFYREEEELWLSRRYKYENGLLDEIWNTYFYEKGPATYLALKNEYYCDGLLKKEIKFKNNVKYSTKTYEYDRGTNCEESPEALDLQIYPNPHQDYFIIRSKGLTFENTTVNIYSLDGRLVYHREIPERLLELRIETPEGVGGGLAPVSEEFLIVNVISNDKSFSKKILRIK